NYGVEQVGGDPEGQARLAAARRQVIANSGSLLREANLTPEEIKRLHRQGAEDVASPGSEQSQQTQVEIVGDAPATTLKSKQYPWTIVKPPYDSRVAYNSVSRVGGSSHLETYADPASGQVGHKYEYENYAE